MQGRLLSLKRSASNIIGNVVKYGQTAKVSITEVGENFAVTVEDGEPGIAESDRERVFHPFVRSEETRVRQAGGSGLGLAIALENRAGGGPRVTLLLPMRDRTPRRVTDMRG